MIFHHHIISLTCYLETCAIIILIISPNRTKYYNHFLKTINEWSNRVVTRKFRRVVSFRKVDYFAGNSQRAKKEGAIVVNYIAVLYQVYEIITPTYSFKVKLHYCDYFIRATLLEYRYIDLSDVLVNCSPLKEAVHPHLLTSPTRVRAKTTYLYLSLYFTTSNCIHSS